MAYGSNILKNEAAYYSLQNATIIDGILHINVGGSATQQITTSDLPSITDTLQFTCIATTYSERYEPNIQVLVHARMTESQKYYNAVLFPVQVEPNRYICEFKLAPGEYSEMYITLSSNIDVSMSLWELCAVAADEDIETIIDGVKQSLPRLLYDYNTFPFDFDQCETTVAVITCRLLQNTDIQGHFLMTFLASQTATLTLRFYDNEAEELFAPLLYDVKVGYNSIGVPHAYMTRLAGAHTFTVTAQIAAGSCHIDTRKILFTIDGGHLAVRELDIAMDVTDLAFRQLSIDNGPDLIYTVGVDAGEILIKYRSYTERNANVGWTAVGSLGRGIMAAVEFDGTWYIRDDSDQYTLHTEEQPWYFWIDVDNVLYACHDLPYDEGDPIVLATDVTSVKACRGYSSSLYSDRDQGLVVAYIKGGKPYYRQYQYQPSTDEKKWLEPQLIVDAQYDFVNVHRLNDYRLGFELSRADDNKWLITDRTYVGQSVPPERINLTSGNAPECICNYPADYDTSINVVQFTYEPGCTDFYVEYDRLLYLSQGILFKDNIASIGLLRYDPYNEDASDIKSIDVIYVESTKHTLVHITLKAALVPTSLIYDVGITLNSGNNPLMWFIADEWGYMQFSPVSVKGTYDNTNYIDHDYDEYYRLPSSGGSNPVAYYPLGRPNKRNLETYRLPNLDNGLVYNPMGKLKNKPAEVVQLNSLTYSTAGIGYFNKNGEPV